jgi:hypothetical protein
VLSVWFVAQQTPAVGRGCVKIHRAAEMPESARQFRGRTFDPDRSESIESQSIALSRKPLLVFTQPRSTAEVPRPLSGTVRSASNGRSRDAAHCRVTARPKRCQAAQRGRHHAHRFLPLRRSSDPRCKKAAAAHELQLLDLSPPRWTLGLLRTKPSEDHGSQRSRRPLRMG